ncbi:MAG: ferritin [Deltaproteobacteria bacterium]|nr:ferritin [Deltaproteobacteria bacterium]
MISDKMQKQLNEQLNLELSSSYLYLAMSAYCRSIVRNGFAHWFEIQAQEEFMHAKKFYEYLLAQDADVEFLAIEKPESVYESLVDLFARSLAHEQLVTKRINALTDLAVADKDHATQVFLQWFITEQIEEENSARSIIESLSQIADSKEGLFLLDLEMGKRVAETGANA